MKSSTFISKRDKRARSSSSSNFTACATLDASNCSSICRLKKAAAAAVSKSTNSQLSPESLEEDLLEVEGDGSELLDSP